MSEKKENRTNPPVVLAISGLDPTSSAGLLADVRVISRLGCYPIGVATCLTVQSSQGIIKIESLEVELISEQIRALAEDMEIKAVKIGAIASEELMKAVGERISVMREVPVVIDPVFAPSKGPSFLDQWGIKALARELLPWAFLATPNVNELGLLVGMEIDSKNDDMLQIGAYRWLETGLSNLLVTGLVRDQAMVDRLYYMSERGSVVENDFKHQRHDVGKVHGTGCVLSSAIVCYLALGFQLNKAIEKGINFTSEVISSSLKFGKGANFWV